MTQYPGVSVRYVSTYHHNQSLLFQFILLEFLESFEEIQWIDALCCRKHVRFFSEQVANLSHENIKIRIDEALCKLVSSAKEYMRLFSWNFSEGLLSKLRAHCTLFLQNAEGDEKELLAMQHYTEKVWQSCLLAIDIIREAPSDRTTFLSFIEKASAAMHRLAKVVTRAIYQFRDDENVLFFILRHKEPFDKLYGNRFTAKLFNRLFPKGIREGQGFMIKRYSERGFNNILPIISAKAAELEASTL